MLNWMNTSVRILADHSLEPDILESASSGPLEALLWTKLVEVMEFQLNYLKS